MRAQKHGLGASFRLLVFLGPFAAGSPEDWDTEFNCVGRVSVLGRDASTTQCGRCVGDAADELMVSGTVPLTSALLQDIVEGDVADLSEENVVPYLKERLAWRVTLFDGQEVDVANVPGLKVSVASTTVTIGEDGLPDYDGQYKVWPEVTAGITGGVGAGEHGYTARVGGQVVGLKDQNGYQILQSKGRI
jgi:tyrosinase